MKNITFLFLGLCFTTGNMIAQSIERQEISSAGAYSTAGNLSLSWTVGQPALVETFTDGTLILTQGFQQVDIGTTSVENPSAQQLQVSVYPNPSAYQFNFAFDAITNGSLEYKIYDNRGRVIQSESSIAVTNGTVTEQIYTTGWAQGMYHLEVRFLSGDKESVFNAKLQYIQ